MKKSYRVVRVRRSFTEAVMRANLAVPEWLMALVRLGWTGEPMVVDLYKAFELWRLAQRVGHTRPPLEFVAKVRA